jgi:hypothetical protein
MRILDYVQPDPSSFKFDKETNTVCVRHGEPRNVRAMLFGLVRDSSPITDWLIHNHTVQNHTLPLPQTYETNRWSAGTTRPT